jgi:hypothetical protein
MLDQLGQSKTKQNTCHMMVSWTLAVLLGKSPIGSIFSRHAQLLLLHRRTLLLKRVATKAATTTMETTILTAVETLVVVILDVCCVS